MSVSLVRVCNVHVQLCVLYRCAFDMWEDGAIVASGKA